MNPADIVYPVFAGVRQRAEQKPILPVLGGWGSNRARCTSGRHAAARRRLGMRMSAPYTHAAHVPARASGYAASAERRLPG